MEWIERLDVTVSKELLRITGLENKQGEEMSKELVDNDFKREGLFLKQAEAAVDFALPKLKQHQIMAKQAEDYFAEMANSDNHMKKTREALKCANFASSKNGQANSSRNGEEEEEDTIQEEIERIYKEVQKRR